MGQIIDELERFAKRLGKRNESFAMKIPFVKQKLDDILALFDRYHESLRKMEDKIVELFGQRVRERRIELDYTQQELANLTGLSRSYLGEIETGKRNITLKNASKIAKALKVDLTCLLKRKS